jgi:hypothetical protein
MASTANQLEAGMPSLAHTHTGTSGHHIPSSPPLVQAAEAEFAQGVQWLLDVVGASPADGRVFIHQVQPFACFGRRARDRKADPADGGAGTDLEPPVRMLSRCHSLSVSMAGAGFVLALLGILMFAWTALPVGIGAFASACLGTCLLAIVVTIALS